MKSKKWIFSKAAVMIFCLGAMAAHGATTRVGNGDDGSDLEGSEPITSGIIFETRAEAVKAMKALNVQGVPGLGLVIPEMEHTEMWLAKSDTHPIAAEGDWERSNDGGKVYARTFAEPHAPTRFFPAALKLNRDQLIALHTHEALHRALPPESRENEDKVAFLTMALTSPSANFDRVSRVAAEVFAEPSHSPRFWQNGGTTVATAEKELIPLPDSSKTQMRLSHTTFTNGFSHPEINAQTLGFEFSPLRPFRAWDLPVEALVSVDGFLIDGGYSTDKYGRLGPVATILKFPVYFAKDKQMGPYAQINLKSLESTDRYNNFDSPYDRDVYSVGVFYKTDSPRAYNSVTATYTFKGGSSMNEGFTGATQDYTFGSIWSAVLHEGFKLGRFSLGGIGEFHHSNGNDFDQGQSAFSIVRAGPEIKWSNGRTTLGLSAVFMVNRGEPESLDNLGDLAGRGAGRNSFNGFLNVAL